MDGLAKVELIKAYIPLAVQITVTIGTIIIAIINNRKKTQESIDSFKEDVDQAIKGTNEKVDALNGRLEVHIKEDEENSIRQSRTRILRFYDEICEKKRHSENHFEEILDDIDNYEKYVATHPEFKNNRGEAAMKYIKEIYHIEKETGEFLKHN